MTLLSHWNPFVSYIFFQKTIQERLEEEENIIGYLLLEFLPKDLNKIILTYVRLVGITTTSTFPDFDDAPRTHHWGHLLETLTGQVCLREAIQYIVTVTKILNDHHFTLKVNSLVNFKSKKRVVQWLIYPAEESPWDKHIVSIKEAFLKAKIDDTRFFALIGR